MTPVNTATAAASATEAPPMRATTTANGVDIVLVVTAIINTRSSPSSRASPQALATPVTPPPVTANKTGPGARFNSTRLP